MNAINMTVKTKKIMNKCNKNDSKEAKFNE